MGIFSNLRRRVRQIFSRWTEVGEYRSRFTSFGRDLFRSELVRSCVRPLAEFTSKAAASSSDDRLAKLLNDRPNIYMDGKAFLTKVRTLYELRNNVFIWLDRDERGKVRSVYPVPYQSLDALEFKGMLFIRFSFAAGKQPVTLPWDDLVALRRDYNESDIVGDPNTPILAVLELINTTNEGVANAVKATANLRGILKSTKAMLSPEAVKAQKDAFVKDYLSLENAGGIASLDATQDFTPINMNPTVANAAQLKEFRENVYRYFGVNDALVMGSMDSDHIEAFYELKIEPFLVALSNAMNAKIFTERERAFGAWVMYEANKLQFASLSKKIQLFQVVVQYGGMTVNEWRKGCNMPPVEGGDELIRRLDAAPTGQSTKDDDKEDNDNE